MIKFYLFLIFIYLTCIYSQTTIVNYYPIDQTGVCEKYIGDTTFSQCSKYLSTSNLDSVYMSSTTNQTDAMKNLDTYFKLLSSYGGPACQTTHTFQTLCSMFLPECESFTNNITSATVAIPKSRICFDTCSGILSTCKIPSALFDCGQLDPVINLPKFPKSFVEYNLTDYGGVSDYTLQCFSPKTDNTSIVIESCPYPLIWRNTTTQTDDINLGYVYVTDNSLCTIQCPAQIFTTKQWNNIYATSDSLSMVSLICCLYLLFTYLIINKKRNKYDYIFSFFVTSVMLMSIASTFGFSVGGTGKLLCPEENRRAVFSDNTCTSSGFLFQFAIINAICWFSINSFELWFQIKFIKKKLELMKYYIPLVLVISLALSIPLLGMGEFRAGLGNFLCWIHSKRNQNVFFWGPLGVVLTIGTGFIGLVIWEIYKIVRSNNKGDFWKLQLKPLMNILLVYLTFVYLIGYNYFIHDSVDDYFDSVEGYYRCILTTDGTDCMIEGPNYSSLLMFVFCIRIYGVYCIILYGYTPKTQRIWRESFLANSSMVSKVKSIFNSGSSSITLGGTSSTDIKISGSSLDSGGGKSSSMEPDDIIIH